METSTYIMPLHRKLTDKEYNITVSRPRKTKHIAESRTKKSVYPRITGTMVKTVAITGYLVYEIT